MSISGEIYRYVIYIVDHCTAFKRNEIYISRVRRKRLMLRKETSQGNVIRALYSLTTVDIIL